MPVVDKQLARIITVLDTREGIEMTCVDGGKGLIAAIPTLFPNVAVQPLRRAQSGMFLNEVRKSDQPGSQARPKASRAITQFALVTDPPC
jgi:transposase-like protein